MKNSETLFKGEIPRLSARLLPPGYSQIAQGVKLLSGDIEAWNDLKKTTVLVRVEEGTLQFSAAAYPVSESAGTATITVTRTGGSNGAVGVSYATSNGTATAGSDYTAASGTLAWADGDSADKTFTVTIANDGTPEGDETVNLTLSSPTGGALIGTLSTAVITISDTVGTLQFSGPTYSVVENAGTATITVTRAGGSLGAVGVSYATSNGTATAGSDYTAASGTLAWVNGDSAAKTFTVPVTDGLFYEASETVNLTLSVPTGGATLGAQSTAVLTITDSGTSNLNPDFGMADLYQHNKSADGGGLATATLTVKTDGTWTITFAAGGTTAGTPVSGTWRTGGAGADHEVKFTLSGQINAPVIVNDAAVYTSLSANRLASVSKTNDDASAIVLVEIRRTGTTTPVLSDSASFEANGSL